MSDHTYNDWKNWETWNVGLWLSSDYETYQLARIAARKGSVEDLRTLAKDYTKAVSMDGVELPMVNWSEIIEHLTEE